MNSNDVEELTAALWRDALATLEAALPREDAAEVALAVERAARRSLRRVLLIESTIHPRRRRPMNDNDQTPDAPNTIPVPPPIPAEPAAAPTATAKTELARAAGEAMIRWYQEAAAEPEPTPADDAERSRRENEEKFQRVFQCWANLIHILGMVQDEALELELALDNLAIGGDDRLHPDVPTTWQDLRHDAAGINWQCGLLVGSLDKEAPAVVKFLVEHY